jgi:PilZ domain
VSDPPVTPPAKQPLPVEVIGSDLFGQQFFELTQTLSIQRNGISISLERKMVPDSEVILRNPETGDEAIAFVVGQIPDDKTGHVYGLVFLDPSANLWHTQFAAVEATSTIQLQCSGCHSVCALSLSEIELEIFHATRELKRFCARCNSLMIWREPHREATGKKPVELPRPDLIPVVVAPPIEERRMNRRAGMKTVACVRHAGVEVIVNCEDISKGGFRFTSRREYPKGIRVEAAVPYTKFSTNIFISAAIIYCQKMPDGRFRHGVTYLKRPNSSGWNP